MTRTKLAIAGALATAGMLAFSSAAFAEGLGVQAGVNAQVQVKGSDEGSESAQAVTYEQTAGEDGMSSSSMSATGTMEMEAHATTTGQQMGEEHQSQVAAQVQTLLSVANRDGGIGDDVRAVAQEMASTSDESAQAKAQVEGRPGWLTFLIGTDYGNLGTLRSDIVKTQNQIQRLTDARNRTTDVTAQAELDAQITALQDSASTTDAFVVSNESKFSLFGWLARLFQ